VDIVVAASDAAGFITLISQDQQQQVKCATYGAHADNKQAAWIKSVFTLPES